MAYVTKSLQFNGTTKYVTLGNTLQPYRLYPFSISIWFKSSSATQQVLMSKQGDGTAYTGWNIQLTATGALRVELVNDDATTNYIRVTTTSTGWADGSWHNVVFCWDGSSTANGVSLFVDGVLENRTNDVDSLTGEITTTAATYFGGRATTGSFLGLTGNLTLILAYSRVLTAQEVSELYNDGTPINPKFHANSKDSLVALWPLGTGDTYPDVLDLDQSPTVPWAAGRKTTYYQIPNETVTKEWGRGVSIRDMSPFYPGPGGTELFSCRMDQASYYRMGPILAKSVTDPFSVSVWLRWTRTGSFYGHFITRGTAYEGTGYFVCTHYGTPGDISFRWIGTGYLVVRTTGLGLNDGNWHHVGVSYDGSKLAAGVHIVVDGVDRSLTVDWNNLSTANYVDSFNLAGYSDSAGTMSFEGWMSQPVFYGTELSVSDFQALYNSGTPVDPTGLASASGIEGFWNLGDPDIQSGALDGTLLNMNSLDRIPGPGGVLTSAFNFNGTNQSIDFGNRYNFEYNQPFTVGVWFRTTTAATMLMVGNMDASLIGYNLYLDSTTKMRIQLANSSTTRIWVETDTSGYNDGNWHLMLMAYDGSGLASGVTIFMDGSAVAMTTLQDDLGGSIVDSGSLRLGCRGDVGTLYWTGDLAGLCFWATELQSADATALWNGGTPVDPTSLDKSTYVVGYWEVGTGFYPGTMTGMSGADIVDDFPYVPVSLTTEKTWTTTANYDTAWGGSDVALGQGILMDWKNKLTTIGWTVIGSGNSTVYEWSGSTGGGSYGGQSTGPFDVWASTTDIVWANTNPAPVGWAVLQSPVTESGQFWLVLTYYSSFGCYGRIFAANAKPTLAATPLTDYPRPSTNEWFWLVANEYFCRPFGASSVRSYFSGCAADGSFIFYRQSLNDTYWYHSQQLHVLTTNEAEPDNLPMRCVGLYWQYTATIQQQWQDWRAYDPESGSVYGLKPVGWGYYPTTQVLNLYTEDYLRGVQVIPVILVRDIPGYTSTAGMMGYPLCRIPDIYIHPSGTVTQGSQAPLQGTPTYISTGALWFPGDTVPVFT